MTEDGRVALEPERLGHRTSSTFLEFPRQLRCERGAQISPTFSIAVHLNVIHQGTRDEIFHAVRYPISVLRPTLSLVDTVVHILGSVFSLTVLGTIVLRLVLDVVPSFDFCPQLHRPRTSENCHESGRHPARCCLDALCMGEQE